MLLKLLREGLGRLIVFINFITRPKMLQRSDAEQKEVDQQASKLSLYQFYACPFCVKTRRVIYQLNLPIETRDAQAGPYREELQSEGGQIKVPCLRIEEDKQVRWMYESSEIIAYLQDNFSSEKRAA